VLCQQSLPERPHDRVPVGGLAITRVLGRMGLVDCIGRRYELDGVAAIPLPHPSGASAWLNAPAHRRLVEEAATLIRAELARVDAA